MVEQLNSEIVNVYNSYIKNNINELIVQTNSPKIYDVYHLYSDGKITYQKGGNEYLQKFEYIHQNSLYYKTMEKKIIDENLKNNTCYTSYNNIFHFPLQSDKYENTTYVILTKKECIYYRYMMNKIIENLFA